MTDTTNELNNLLTDVDESLNRFRFDVISGAASKEFSLEKGMKAMAEEWNTVVFSTTKYRLTRS